MRWRLHLHHEHGTHDIPNVIEGDTVNVPAGLAIQSVGLEPEPDTTVIPPTSVPGGPAEPTFAEPEPASELLIADETGNLNQTATTATSTPEPASGDVAGLTP